MKIYQLKVAEMINQGPATVETDSVWTRMAEHDWLVCGADQKLGS